MVSMIERESGLYLPRILMMLVCVNPFRVCMSLIIAMFVYTQDSYMHLRV